MIQKRNNPLTINTTADQAAELQPQPAPAPIQAPAPAPQLKPQKPTSIKGKYKKKTVKARVSKALVAELLLATGQKKIGAVIEEALLQYAFEEKPKAYLRTKAELESKGCEIK